MTEPNGDQRDQASGGEPASRREQASGTPAPIRVLLVDDQRLIRMGFRMVLDTEPDVTVVGEAGDGAEALRIAADTRPDVVLMDVRMPRMDGIEATTQLLAQHPSMKVVVLTTFDLDEYAFAAVRAGASGFLLKDAHPHELTGAIRAAHAGEAALSPRVTRRMLELFGQSLPADGTPGGASEQDTRADGSPLGTLTDREREVFAAIGRGLTNAEIGAALFVSESTVKTHVGRVLAKIEARDRVHAVILAHQWGIVSAQD